MLARVPGAVACDAFWSIADDLCHAVVLDRDGGLTDITYAAGGAVRATSNVGVADGALDVTAFWSDVDEMRNVIAIAGSGQLPHFRRTGDEPWTSLRRRDVPGAARVAGYDDHHHGIVLTGAGRITDEPFHGVTAAVQQAFVEDTAQALAQSGRAAAAHAVTRPTDEEPAIHVADVPDAVDISALWADGQNRFVIALDRNGAVIEFGYGIHQPQTRRVLASFPGASRVSSCYVNDPATGRRVVVLTHEGVHVLRYGAELPGDTRPIATAARDVGCFAKRDGVLRIVLVAGDEIVELATDDV